MNSRKSQYSKKQWIRNGAIFGVITGFLAQFVINPLLWNHDLPNFNVKLFVSLLIWLLVGIGYGLTMYKLENRKRK